MVGNLGLLLLISISFFIIFTIPVNRMDTFKCAIYIFIFVFGSFIFNSITQETYNHYNSYKYILIVIAIFGIFSIYYHDIIDNNNSCKYLSFLETLGIGYVLVILLFPILHLYNLVKSTNNIFGLEFYQSFVVTTFSFILCHIILILSRLFVLRGKSPKENLLKVYKKKYGYYKESGKQKKPKGSKKDRQSSLNKKSSIKDVFYTIWINLCNLFKLFDKAFKLTLSTIKHNIRGSLMLVITVISLVFVHFSGTMHQFNSEFHNNSWRIEMINQIHMNHIVKLNGHTYYEHGIKDISKYYKLNPHGKYNIRLKGEKLLINPYIHETKYGIKHFGKLEETPLVFDMRRRNAYYFKGEGHIKHTDGFVSKDNIIMKFTPNNNMK